ncbi:hypothetical protein KKH39_01625 [Patescibacteria group bacterium]|nr:hypothetical protein [Patescibacteria group bacterium]
MYFIQKYWPIVSQKTICYDTFMGKFFKRNKKSALRSDKVHPPKPRKVDERDLVDPIYYIGDLDGQKYPSLPLENEKKPEEDVENPLNKR